MKKKIKLDKKKILNYVGYGICLVLLSWIGASFIDVVTNNIGNYTYQPWNLFVLLFC